MNRTDEEIKVDIVKHLNWNASVDASNIKVSVDDGDVKLTGLVPYFSSRRAAEDSVSMVNGTNSIDNQLIVEYPRAIKLPNDMEIRNNVNNALLWDSDIFSVDIDVSVDDGNVTLEGTVDAYWKKLRAENITSNILGVVTVDNKLAVTPTEKYSDKAIADDIVEAIDRMTVGDASEVNVRVEDGVVTLSGQVDSWIAKRAIENAAEFTAGVIDVMSLLTINY